MEDYNYCPECGQINTTKQVPLKLFFHDILGDYFTFDSRFFRSFIPLLRKPGHLTNEYNSGRRVSYILPLRLYLFVTILFFFIISLQGKIGLSNLEPHAEENQVATKDSIHPMFIHFNCSGNFIPGSQSSQYTCPSRLVYGADSGIKIFD